MTESPPGSEPLVEHAFRHHYGRLVATLAGTFGFHRTEQIEDAVQSALLVALATWPKRGTPDDAAAWLYRVARNRLTDELRRKSGPVESAETETDTTDAPTFDSEIHDDELRMLFVCADAAIPSESQLVLALKTLCGFSTKEIALRLLTTEANVQKRLTRARERLRTLDSSWETPSLTVLQSRLPSVQRIVYLLFNEGYSSALADRPIRRELCEEALRLGHLLIAHPATDRPESLALLALMYLHAARFDARLDGAGGLLLLEDQDRSLWDAESIRRGLFFLQQSARGDAFSRYHIEAAIAVEHCLAPSYAETRWNEIVDLYSLLEKLEPSPLHTLNRAIATAEWQGAAAGLAILRAVTPPSWLLGYYLWDATWGELERRAGNMEKARLYLERARAAAPSDAEKSLLTRKLAACD